MKASHRHNVQNSRELTEHSNEPVIQGERHDDGVFPHELLTEEELVDFLRIPKISNSGNYHNVVEHLKRLRGLPRLRICNKTLYPKKAILRWIEEETDNGE